MTVIGSWCFSTDGPVYTAQVALGGRVAVVRARLGHVEKACLLDYAGAFGVAEVERAAQVVAVNRVRHLTA